MRRLDEGGAEASQRTRHDANQQRTTATPSIARPDTTEYHNQRGAYASISDLYEPHQNLEPVLDGSAQSDISPVATTPQHHNLPEQASSDSFDVTIHTDNSRHRRKFMGGSSLQSLVGYLDAYLEQPDLPKVGTALNHGMKFVEEFAVPFHTKLLLLPPTATVTIYIDAFVRSIYPLFPILNMNHLHFEIHRIRSIQVSHCDQDPGSSDWATHLQPSDLPSLACIYATLSLGADESQGTASKVGETFLKAAYQFYAQIIGLPYLSSVQALVLLTLGLRARGKEGQGFQTLGSAIRIAHSMGIHRFIPTTGGILDEDRMISDPPTDGELYSRVWWTCYALEMLFQVESGRPAAARHDRDASLRLDTYLDTGVRDTFPYFAYWTALAVILGRISKMLYSTPRTQDRLLELLQNTSVLDKSLSDWKNSIPEDIRPGSDLFCDDTDMMFSCFLSFQYHQAVITLHRAALIVPQALYRQMIDTHADHLSFYHRLRRGADLCVASARAIIRLDTDVAGHRLQTPLVTLTPTLLACVVLALHVIRNPTSPTVAADLGLLSTGCQLFEDEFRRIGQSTDFIEACSLLRQSAESLTFYQRAAVTKLCHSSWPGQQANTRSDHSSRDSMLTQQPLPISPGLIESASRLDFFHTPEDFWSFIGIADPASEEFFSLPGS